MWMTTLHRLRTEKHTFFLFINIIIIIIRCCCYIYSDPSEVGVQLPEMAGDTADDENSCTRKVSLAWLRVLWRNENNHTVTFSHNIILAMSYSVYTSHVKHFHHKSIKTYMYHYHDYAVKKQYILPTYNN